MDKLLKRVNTQNSKFNIVLNWISIVALSLSICRLLIQRLQVYFFNSNIEDDAGLFVKSFNYFIEYGWYKSVAIGSSPLFNLFSLPFYLVTGNVLLSFKLLNISCLLIILILWSRFLIKNLALNKKYAIVSTLFIIQTGLMQNTFFVGINDALFSLFITFGFIYLYRNISENKGKTKFIILSACFFSFALSVRELFLLYLPGILLIFIMLIVRKQIKLKLIIYWLLTLTLIIISIHYPSLQRSQKISMLDKEPQGINANWTELNYLHVTRGSYSKPSWSDVLDYKKNHGENSLPKNYLAAIFKDISLSCKNFVVKLYLAQLSFISKLGLFYVFIMLYGVYLFFRKKLLKNTYLWVPLSFYIIYSFCLSLILIIPNLQFRWFIVFPFLLEVFAISEITKLIDSNKNITYLFYFNIIALAILNSLLIGIW